MTDTVNESIFEYLCDNLKLKTDMTTSICGIGEQITVTNTIMLRNPLTNDFDEVDSSSDSVKTAPWAGES